MDFQQSIKTCFQKFADFSGRASLPEFWWFALFIVVAGTVLSIVSGILSGLFYLGTLVPSLAVGARRLHDTGRSGWWQLIGLIPVIGWIVIIVMMVQKGKTAEPTA